MFRDRLDIGSKTKNGSESQGFRLNSGYVGKQYLWGSLWGKLEGDNFFDYLLMHLGRNFLEAAGNFHMHNNSCIFP